MKTMVRWAVEWMMEEAETYRTNHPETTVFHMDAENFLRLAIRWRDHFNAPLPGREALSGRCNYAALPRKHSGSGGGGGGWLV